MKNKPEPGFIVLTLITAVVLWGGNNAGTKFLIGSWPPIFIGSTRFLIGGVVLFALLRWTNWFGDRRQISAELKRRLWWRSGLSIALYILAFNFALKLTAASHVALYLGASPVWALLWEGKPEKNWRTLPRYFAAALAFAGVIVLVWPTLRHGSSQLPGELLGLVASVLWTNYGRQCRLLTADLSNAEISAHSFWRAGLLMAPFAIIELCFQRLPITPKLVTVHLLCILASNVVAFGLWNNALRHWKTSQVFLFNNFIPLTTATWAHFCLGEQISQTFWCAMGLIVLGVVLGQANWQRVFGTSWVPEE